VTRLGIGLIGCGFIGRFHSTGIRASIRRGLIDADYIGVCDADLSRARSFADITGARIVTNDPAEIIDSEDINVVYVCVPTSGHKDLVLRAAAAGKHVFCEKPLATNLTDVEEMVSAVEAAGVKHGVGLILRHSPIFTVLKSLTEDGSLGRLMTIVFRDDQFFPVQGHYDSDWRADRAIVGAGTLLEHSIHDVDVLRWFGGEIQSVRGSVRNFAGYEGVEDLAAGHFEFESGALGELTSIWHSVLGRPSTRRFEMFFEKGLFWLDNDFLGPIHFQAHANNAETVIEEEVRSRYFRLAGLEGAEFEAAFRYSFEDYLFLKAVSENSPPYPDFRVALEAHRAVDAIYRSAASDGAKIRL
jgi:myo-inositol 2-dehydrogenase / D-chiro-inositol 1-dehydrogenase